MESPLQKAIRLSGGQAALAFRLEIDKSAVNKWDRCPSDRVLAVSEACGWQVTPHELRSDLYPNPSDALPTIEVD